MQPEKLRLFISLYSGFMISISCFALLFFSVLPFTWMNGDRFYNQLLASKVPQEIYENIRVDFQSLSIPSYIPEQYFYNCIDQDQVTDDLKQAVNYVYNKQSATFSTQELRNKLLESFLSYTQSKQIEQTVLLNDSLGELADHAAAIYAKNVELPFSVTLRGYMVKSAKFIDTGLFIATLIGFSFSLFLFKLYKSGKQALRYLLNGIMGAGIMGFFIPLALLVFRPYEKLNIASAAYHNTIMQFMDNGLAALITLSAAVFILSVGTAYAFKIIGYTDEPLLQ